jgi:hypothetical protein
MTSEALYPVSETYEGLRDSVENSEARAAWNDADRRRALLTDTYRNFRMIRATPTSTRLLRCGRPTISRASTSRRPQ